MSDSTMVFDDLDAVGFDDSTTPTGRINQSKPRIAVIGGSAAAVQAALIASKYYGNKFDVITADYGEIEDRVLAHMSPEELLMQEMENVYKAQVVREEALNKFMQDPYGIPMREKGQGRKNGHRSSYVAKDHRSATKRQRSARKKNRKK